jgi:hypothetical protein
LKDDFGDDISSISSSDDSDDILSSSLLLFEFILIGHNFNNDRETFALFNGCSGRKDLKSKLVRIELLLNRHSRR